MKKSYTRPAAKDMQVEIETLMASVSGGDIGYGGVDTEGREADGKGRGWDEF